MTPSSRKADKRNDVKTQVSLDSLTGIKKLDTENVLGSVEAFPDQCLHAWEEANKVEVPGSYWGVKNLVMTGMGGSGLGARLIEGVFKRELKIPLVRVNDYDLPGFVNQETLVICTSYSGTTEEVIENMKQAKTKKAKMVAMGTGGTLGEMASDWGVPFYKIVPKYNPSNQPRMTVGYQVVGQVVLVNKAGLLSLRKKDVDEAVRVMRGVQEKVKVEVKAKENRAKRLAEKMRGKLVAYTAAEHLAGALHAVKNQSNENAKHFAARFDIPELNHHLMEGLRFPEVNKRDLLFLMAVSDLYLEKISKRVAITKEVIEKNGIEVEVIEAKAGSKLAQAFEVIQLGAYAVFYLSVLHGINPAPIPWVGYFKKRIRN
jgi:glucose/mannose-6-phosphate isomerase